MFRIHEKYIIRHAVLKYLKKELDKKQDKAINPKVKMDLNKSNMYFQDLVKLLKIDEKKLYEYHFAMHYVPNDQIWCEMKDGKYIIGLHEPGVAAYIEGYWLREGQKELNERIYDKTKWVVPIIALLITAASLSYSVYTTQQSRNKIELIQKEIEKIKRQTQPPVGTSVQRGQKK